MGFSEYLPLCIYLKHFNLAFPYFYQQSKRLSSSHTLLFTWIQKYNKI